MTILTACRDCAGKLGQQNDLEELPGTERTETCPWCWQVKTVRSWEDYGRRRPVYSRARPGGGERSRAGK